MALWDSFLSTVKGIGEDIASIPKGIAEGVLGMGAGIASAQAGQAGLPTRTEIPRPEGFVGPLPLQQPLQAKLQESATKALKEIGGKKTAVQASTDLLAKAAKPIGEVVSYGVNRPAATLGLLTDPNSPLYQPGTKGEGFQASDIIKAWNRSEKVSPFQAYTKSAAFTYSPFGELATQLLNEYGDINVKNINLWDDKDIQKNYVDNVVGKFFTGPGDFILSNAAFGGVASLTKTIVGAGLRAANLTTKIVSAEDLARLDTLADSHIVNVQSNGTMGRQTVFGADVMQLAETTDAGLITSKVRLYSNNEALPTLIQRTTDPRLVKDFLLADKGYMPAIERLGKTNPADLWELGDINNYIKGNVIVSKKLPTYAGEELDRVKAAYDDSIARVPGHQKVLDAFLDPEGRPKYLGTDYKPVDPAIGGGVIGKVRTRTAEIGQAAKVRDFSNIGGVAETVLGGGANRPTSVLLHFFGTKLPRGYISFSGLRPFDHVDEVNAVFDDIPLFRNGKNEIVIGYENVNGTMLAKKVTASKYRQEVINALMSKDRVPDKQAIIEELDKRIGYDIARTRGFTNMDDVKSFVDDARNSLRTTHDNLIRDGYSFDAQGNRLIVNEKTQRQIADTIPMLPWGKIDRAIVRELGGAKGATIAQRGKMAGTAIHEYTHAGFDALNKVFSISVLGRPAYVPKNSVIEPLISASLSMGHDYWTDTIGTLTSNALKNNANRIKGAAVKIVKGPELRRVNKEIDVKFEKVGKAKEILDTALAEYKTAFEYDGLSPAALAEHGATIKANLRDAQRLVDRLEVELGISVKNYGEVKDVPSLAGLERRIQFLKDNGYANLFPEGPSYREKVRKMMSKESKLSKDFAERVGAGKFELTLGEQINKAMAKATKEINSLSPDIEELNKTIENAYKLIDKVVEEGKLATKEQADILARLEKFKVRYYGKQGPVYHTIGDNIIEDSSLYDPQKFGEAIRSEFSNADTAELSIINELRTGSKVGSLSRKSPNGVTDTSSPLYFEELAWVMNRHFRGDPLVDQILSNNNIDDVLEWAYSEKGLKYFRQFGEKSGVYTKDDIAPYVNTQYLQLNRYLPTEAARLYVLKNPAKAGELQKLLADKIDVLSPIHPTDIDYGSAVNLNPLKRAVDATGKLTTGLWKKLAGAENPYRWLYGEKRFYQIQDYKLNMLKQQGIDVTTENANAIRQASAREALKEAEKVFYTIRRNDRYVYAARTVASFPAASINALYRFGRLAIKDPMRSAQFLANYDRMFLTFGIDENGDPIDDISKAKYLVVPGTKEMGVFGDKGIRLSAKTVGFLANTPGPSWLATLAVGTILDWKPTNKTVLKSIVDSTVGNIPGLDYDSLFPVGAKADAGAMFIPSWVQDLARAINLNSDAEFLKTFNMVHQHNMTMYEMGLGPKPTIAQDKKQTQAWFMNRAKWKFGSPLGITPQLDRPGQIFQDLTSAYMQKNNGDMDKTQADLQKALGANFPADRWLYRGSTRATYVAPTLDGYKAIWQDNAALAANLAKLNPKLVGLLTADISGDDPDTQMQRFLSQSDLKLPGGTLLNSEPLTPQQIENTIQVNRAWNVYRDNKQKVMDAIHKAGYTRIADVPEVKAKWEDFLSQMYQYNKDWGKEYKKNSTEDKAYEYAQALSDITKNKAFMDTQKHGSSDFFTQAKFFLEQRNKIVDAYKKAPKGSKGLLQAAWITYIQETTSGMWNPQMQQIIDRYFVNDKLTETI